MKYIITENKINELILKYINDYYDLGDINYSRYVDDYGNETNVIEYYIGDWSDGVIIFYLYEKNHWSKDNQYKINLSPILVIEDQEFTHKLNGMFGKLWIPVFKTWFEDNFNEKVKTIDYYS